MIPHPCLYRWVKRMGWELCVCLRMPEVSNILELEF